MEADEAKAIDFLRKYISQFPASINSTNIMKYLRSGVPLCK